MSVTLEDMGECSPELVLTEVLDGNCPRLECVDQMVECIVGVTLVFVRRVRRYQSNCGRRAVVPLDVDGVTVADPGDEGLALVEIGGRTRLLAANARAGGCYEEQGDQTPSDLEASRSMARLRRRRR